MEPWHIWAATGLALCVGEMLVPGFFLLFLGIGAFVAAALSAIGATFEVAAVMAALVGATLTLLSRTLFRSLFFPAHATAPEARTNLDALIGRSARVTLAIPGGGERGQVKLGGDIWTAASLDDTPLALDTPVEVVRIEGAHLVVRKADTVTAHGA